MNQVAQYEGSGVGNLADTTSSLAVQLAQVEIDSAVSTAKKFPRSLSVVQRNIIDLVMLDAETAEECVYALPRVGKPIKGPSVRFAEIVASQYGNCHVGSRVVDVNRLEKYVEAEGVFIDLQTGMKRTARTRRRIVDKNGRLYNDDMIIVTGNATCSIALREAILKGVPKALWRAAYDAAETVIAGDVKTLAVRRGEALKAFATFGVTPDQIFASLEVEGVDDIGLDQIATLKAMFKAIRAGEQQVEDYFPAKSNAAAGVSAAKGTAAKLSEIAKSSGPTVSDKDAQKEADHQAAENNRNDDAARQKMQDERDAKSEPTVGDADGSIDDDDPPVTDEQVAAALAQGREARKAGRKQAACPKDVRANQRLYDAWSEGWAEADEEIARQTRAEGD